MNSRTKLLSLLFALAIVAAACSSSDEDAEVGNEESDAGDQVESAGAIDDDATQAAMEGSDDSGVEASEGATRQAASIGELEAEWAEARAGIVADIEAGGYGISEDNVLIGPSGFEVDLNECPSDWSDTAGVADGTIKIGETIPQTGSLGSNGDIAVGLGAYFDYVNANGGIGGNQIDLVVKNDEYVPTKTIELVKELLQTEDPFYITTLGSPNTLAVYDSLNDKCVPQPFVMTGHPAWGDPVNHPWTTGLQLSYTAEVTLWGNYIKKELADKLPIKVGALVMDNDFGSTYEGAFKKWADDNPDVVSEFKPVPHDQQAATLTAEMTTLASFEPEVFISMTAGDPCLLAVQEAASSGLKETADILFASSICKDPNAYMIPAGEAADGFLIAGGGVKASTDPQHAGEPFVKFMNETLDAAGLDPSIGMYGTGFGEYGFAHVEALRIAAELEGGLTRTNFLLALRSMNLKHPMFLDGISFAVDGAADAFYVEGTEFSRYDAAAESWIQLGDVVDLNGTSPNCAWSDDGC